MFSFLDRLIKRWVGGKAVEPAPAPSFIRPVPAGETPGYSLTRVPFYPSPLTPAEFAAMGDIEVKIGQKICKCVKKKRRKSK